MSAHAFARCVFVALLAAGLAVPGAHRAYAAPNDQPAVKRLWSQFPIGPRLPVLPANHKRHLKAAPPATTATGTDGASPRPGAARVEARHVPAWLWPLVALVAAALIATALWLWARRRTRGRAAPEPVTHEAPPQAASRLAEPAEANVAAPPQAPRPWASADPRTFDTLPRHELFEIANALGIENTVLMSRAELIEALRPSGPPTAIAAPKVSDAALARYAAAYVAACRSGDRAPIAALGAIVPPTTEDAAAYSKRMVAEARRRGLLTRPGRGRSGGELTARSWRLLHELADDQQSSTP